MVTAAGRRVNGTRGALLVLLACLHVLGAVGLPMPSVPVTTRMDKARGGPVYPCQNRPCGCLSYEQCWAGDCCCFTLEQKIGWARDQGENVPETALAKLADREGSCTQEPCEHCVREKSCCERSQTREPENNKTLFSGWKVVIGSFVSGCHGESGSGPVSLLPVAITDSLMIELAVFSSFFAGFSGRNEDATRLSNPPAAPPPKA